ncbi:MAG: T9SS type A sorting domain-containing protein [Bacteroidetes bacterium]|nr:T9SS type A sorting domain-containing protein [Bacteroidota bacterium]
MKNLYNKTIAASLVVAIAITGVACGQNAKVKTITIVNGDTTISEKTIGKDEIAEIEKQITMVISEDGKAGDKKIVKKIIINGDEKNAEDAMAFAYSIHDSNNENIEVTTDENGNTTTKVIVKEGGKEGEATSEKKVVKKTVVINDGKAEKEDLNVTINVKKNAVKIDMASSSKEPINVSILDENGKQIHYDSQKEGGNYSKEIKLEKKGTYFLNIIHNKQSTSEKIVIP